VGPSPAVEAWARNEWICGVDAVLVIVAIREQNAKFSFSFRLTNACLIKHADCYSRGRWEVGGSRRTVFSGGHVGGGYMPSCHHMDEIIVVSMNTMRRVGTEYSRLVN
jgi:hypothetical protein